MAPDARSRVRIVGAQRTWRVAGVVPAGGASRRMGGVDKTRLAIGGVALLDRVLSAARAVCDPLVVVGEPRPTAIEGVTFVLEQPCGGGPVPAVLAGIRAAGPCDVVLLLASDLPLLVAADLDRLVAGLADHPEADAVAACDHRGLPNPLLAAYRAPVLRRTMRCQAAAGVPASRLLPPSVAMVELGASAVLNVNRRADVSRASASLSARAVPS
jgi:molybdopterin-guanine dinucleotide biosynthesis protein A